jgi:hypothetical protein
MVKQNIGWLGPRQKNDWVLHWSLTAVFLTPNTSTTNT